MYRSNDVIRPKTKIRVELHTGAGTILEGFVFVSGHERVLDLLNNKELFLPFEVSDGRHVMLNKELIAAIWPHDQKWMENTYATAPLAQGPARKTANQPG
ncbi:MAG TPA: hypothetical protein VGA50_05680 [Kiloniellales bacterium]